MMMPSDQSGRAKQTLVHRIVCLYIGDNGAIKSLLGPSLIVNEFPLLILIVSILKFEQPVAKERKPELW